MNRDEIVQETAKETARHVPLSAARPQDFEKETDLADKEQKTFQMFCIYRGQEIVHGLWSSTIIRDSLTWVCQPKKITS